MKISGELLKGSTSTLILSLLEEKSMYGYEIIKTLEEKSNGIFSFKEGTLYPLLHSLESDGYLESYWDLGENNRKRKYYSITQKGKKQIQYKKEEWSVFSKTVDKVLGGNIYGFNEK
ncbi:helix-turn-helix transcriptional regulator [Tissierella sp. MSJ-40]|uniref:Helix-turn-helix transcriptional regulator n=1 Tax=Tissierella simiarum TaxID=2841534 RepID=A0ABS6E9F3_9FIRM|nr:helix-turn-helix transcriptional regulator [Tissierella simiarum]MBU5439045.1 helix-turn-helix transcriptional regulator [Tissierella simiarum]